MKNRLLLTILITFMIGLSNPSHMSSQGGPDPQTSPVLGPGTNPGAEPGVGRMSVVQGDVATMRGDGGDWVAASVNTPLSPGDGVATAERSRAEVQLDFATVLHLDQKTEVRITDLATKRMQLQVASGLVEITLFKGSEADVEIDTPNMAVHPLAEGVYRIQVDSPTQTQLVVREGEAEVLTQQGSEKVERDQVIFVEGSDNPEYRIDRAPGRDGFDKWTNDRDRQIGNEQAYTHTDRYYTGSSDLEGNGQWENVPGYDWCWTPEVDAGWVPYRYGRWGYEPYWGWTWISAEPWGWAPYHYGRWFSYGDRWHWWPGVGGYGHRPLWGPGYVSFFGFGGGGVGVGFGSIGWLPLGPRDAFHPWWGRGRGSSVTRFDDFHSRGGAFTTAGGRHFGSNLEGVMRDGHMRGAITTVSSHDFASGRMGRYQPVSEGMLHSASMVRGALPVAPTRESLGPRAFGRGNFAAGTFSGQHFYSRNPVQTGRTSNFSSQPRQGRSFEQRAPGGGNANPNWQRFDPANRSSRWPAGVNMRGTHGSSPVAPSRQGYAWSPQSSPGSFERSGTQPRAPMSLGAAPRAYQPRGGAPGGWNSPAPRSGGSYSRGSRPPMELNRPVMRERPGGGGGYGGGRTNSAPSGGHYSAPSGGGHNYSAPRGGGGGGGGGGNHGGGGGGSHGNNGRH